MFQFVKFVDNFFAPWPHCEIDKSYLLGGWISMKIMQIILLYSTILPILLFAGEFDKENIPLPEHPRPDFQRENWINLNACS